jgi:hypothetical protein
MSNIHAALVGAMKEISAKGIAKLSRADLGGAKVNYRGIEAAMNEMCVVLIHHGITVTPSYSDLTVTERAKGEGKATRFVVLKGTFTFAADDGSNVSCEVFGEAMDSGDKAVVKAQSVAFRTALFQQFVVPTMAMDPEEGEDQGGPNDEALSHAEKGTKAYQAYWNGLSADQRRALGPHHSELKAIAADADKRQEVTQ